MEPAFRRRIPDASLGQAKEKISGKKRENRGRTKRSRRSNAQVSLDNADAVIEGAPHVGFTCGAFDFVVPSFCPLSGSIATVRIKLPRVKSARGAPLVC